MCLVRPDAQADTACSSAAYSARPPSVTKASEPSGGSSQGGAAERRGACCCCCRARSSIMPMSAAPCGAWSDPACSAHALAMHRSSHWDMAWT